MPVTTLDPKTALIVVDLQKGIVSLPAAHPIDGVIANAVALLEAFRRRNLPVVLVNVAGVAPGRSEQAIAALAPGYWLFGGALVVTGIAALTITNSSNGLMQLTTEPAMRGRVIAIRMAVALGGTPIGAPFVGWIANTFGPRWAIAVAATAGLAAAAVGARYLMQRSNPTPPSV